MTYKLIDAAQTRWRKVNARKVDAPELVALVRALTISLHASGESAVTIAATLGVNRETVYRVLAESNVD